MAVFGVDISENNGAVDFAALKGAGVRFALIRCGYGSDDTEQDDTRFFENVRKARAAGIPYGVYLYSYALNTGEAKSEAAHALRLLGQIAKPAYGVWFDMEDADHYKLKHGMPSSDTLVKICEAFCVELEAQGYYIGIYAAVSWLNNQLNDSRLDKYDKWVAQWNDVCEYRKPYGLWQYTEEMYIGGERFDANWAYKDYPALTGTKSEEEEMTYEQWREFQARYEKEQAAKPVSGWAREAVEHVRETGQMVGDGEGNFRPQSPVTRQELAQALYNRDSGK